MNKEFKSQSKVRVIKKDQWKKLKEATYVTIMMLLDDVGILIENFSDPRYTSQRSTFVITALYTHAIEEFGKLIYLKKLTPENDEVKIDYVEKFTCHDYKFKTALDKLSKECVVVQRGENGEETLAIWSTRLNILNTDIDENGNFKHRPLINFNDLCNAISEFKKVMKKTDYR